MAIAGSLKIKWILEFSSRVAMKPGSAHPNGQAHGGFNHLLALFGNKVFHY